MRWRIRPIGGIGGIGGIGRRVGLEYGIVAPSGGGGWTDDTTGGMDEGTTPQMDGGTLRFEPVAPPEPPEGTTVVVLDTVWSSSPSDLATRRVGLRPIVERIMTSRDLFTEAAEQLDAWTEASGIVAHLALEGTSFWFGERLRYWTWLLDEIIWLGVMDELLAQLPGTRRIECGVGTDPALIVAARLVAARDGLAFREDRTGAPDAGATQPAAAVAHAPRPGRSLLGRARWRLHPPEPERRRRAIARRLAALEGDRQPRLLVVQAHVRQRIDTPTGPRFINPFLGPVMDRLRGTRLDPIEVDIRSTMSDDGHWRRLRARESARTLPVEVLAMTGPGITREAARAEADRIAERIGAVTVPLLVSGVDLGPVLATLIADRTRRSFPRSIRDVARIRALLRRLRPAGILIADEYHRQDWLAAAAAEGVPTAAIQHGVIYDRHAGYIHRSRPPELRLPERTYVFGEWERGLLTSTSVYHPDEVHVGGSPRLDLVEPAAVDRDAVRAQLSVAPGDKLVVLSGTWGAMDRRFQYPIGLTHLFDRPLPGVHLVVKLHPTEKDEGPYRRIIECAASAGGFAPPPITVVQEVDLYRLLAAADAHLGIHSTLLTETVFTGTPNLLANALQASDLLGYVDAGVAIPVRDGGDLAATLDRPRAEAMPAENRDAFLRHHFEPGMASQRIADDLLAWMR